MKNRLRRILLVVLCLVFLGCAAYLTYYYIEQARTQHTLQDLAAQVAAAREAAASPSPSPTGEPGLPEASASPEAPDRSPPPDGIAPPEPDDKPRQTPTPDSPGDVQEPGGMLRQYAGLFASNPDIVGWLTIPGTVIDYPVMQTPEDQNYYLRRGWDGKYSAYGLLFVDANCDPAASDNVIIYGHKKYDGQMFGRLTDYADSAYWQGHKTLRFDTLYEERTYEVVAAFRSRVLYQAEEGFRYYRFYDAEDQAAYDDYIQNIRDLALYDTGIVPQYGDKLLTLSTCSSYTSNGRFVVVARLVPEEDADGAPPS